jgi:Domain of unknown function (DUF1735)/Domain of unknown function (DUF4361)
MPVEKHNAKLLMLYTFISVCIGLTFFSCTKQAGDPERMALQETGFQSVSLSYSAKTQTITLQVILPRPTLNEITLQIEKAADAMDMYNRAKGTNYRIIPDSAYQIPDKITITGGSKGVSIPIQIVTGKIINNQSVMLPLRIKEPGANRIDSLSGTVLYAISVSNEYSGVYEFSLATHDFSTGITPCKVNEWEVYPYGEKGIWFYQPVHDHTLNPPLTTIASIIPAITVNDDNSLTLSRLPSSVMEPEIIPGINNRYDPVSHTFYFSYSMNMQSKKIFDTIRFIKR